MRKLIKYYRTHPVDFQITVVSLVMFVLGLVLWQFGL